MHCTADLWGLDMLGGGAISFYCTCSACTGYRSVYVINLHSLRRRSTPGRKSLQTVALPCLGVGQSAILAVFTWVLQVSTNLIHGTEYQILVIPVRVMASNVVELDRLMWVQGSFISYSGGSPWGIPRD